MSTLQTCMHGGRLFDSIGSDYENLDRLHQYYPADVLDAWYPPAPIVIEKLTRFLSWGTRTSPPPTNDNMINLIAQHYRIEPDTVVVGSGSSELIHRILPKFCDQRGAVIAKPAYGEYEYVLMQILGLRVYDLLTDQNKFQTDISALIALVRRHSPSAVILINPNNPSGQSIDPYGLKCLLNELPKTTNLIIDETYSEFSNQADSVLEMCAEYENLVVFKSLSKSFALSGLRVGFCAMHPKHARVYQRATAPYIMSTIGQIALFETFKSADYYAAKIAQTHSIRQGFIDRIAAVAPQVRVIPSQINSVLLDLKSTSMKARRLVEAMRENRIYIRSIDDQGVSELNRFVRISILEPQAMAFIANTLGSILHKDL